MAADKIIYPRDVTDDLGVTLTLQRTPARIISLVPSLTELLCDLGLEDQIVGLTKFCVHPAGLKKQKEIIGGTKNLRSEKILNLQPDIILANREENDKEQVEALSKDLNLYTTVIVDFEDATRCIRELGALFEKRAEAEAIIAANKATIKSLKSPEVKRAAYLIWRKPWMTIGGDTYIHDMMDRLGYENVFGNQERYPSFELTELIDKKVDVILLSSEPYPFKEEHIKEIKEVVPGVGVKLVDGELYSWYGSRLANIIDV